MVEPRARDTARLSIAVGFVAAGSAISLATFFAIGGPFGTINDIGNGAIGVLSAGLAWRLRGRVSGQVGGVATGLALVGAGITVIGSALIVSDTTGFFLAGLVSSVGFAGMGAWLIALNRSDQAGAMPRGLRSLGIAAGGLMALGAAAIPGILLRLDDLATAPGWIWISAFGWLGVYVVYPVWAIWFGIVGPRPAPQTGSSAGSVLPGEDQEARSWISS